jgi:alanine dehydrogenase
MLKRSHVQSSLVAGATADEQAPYLVSADAVRDGLDWKVLVEAIASAYANGEGSAHGPGRTVAEDGAAFFRLLPAMPPGSPYFGAKIMGGAMSAGEGTSVQYLIVLFDRRTRRIAALLDANLVTAYRTAATSAAAMDRIAPAGGIRLGVLGSGQEAATHVRAFAAVRDVESITVFSPNRPRRTAFAEAVVCDIGVPCTPVDDPRDAVGAANVVLAAARSRGERPILYADWLASGTAVVSIGSTVPSQRELDVSVLARSDLIVCDEVEEVLHETGDLIEARSAGVVIDHKVCSIRELMAGSVNDRLTQADLPLFKSVGSGIQDIVAAGIFLERAIASGSAVRLPFALHTKT